MFKYIVVGFFFGFGMWKLEAISAFRIMEMFHFQSFHMYGIIISGVLTSMIITQLFRKGKIKTIKGIQHQFNDKDRTWPTGVCTGMMFVLLGAGYTVFVVFMGSAMLGTFVYGLTRKWLPH